MRSDRMRRVDQAIRQVIGDAVATELKDPRVGFVTVTDVRTSADLNHARVYVSVLGEPAEREATLAGLRSGHGYLQGRVAAELHLRRTPTLSFVYDDTTDRALHIQALIDAQERRFSTPGGAGLQEPRPRERLTANRWGAGGRESPHATPDSGARSS